MNFYTIEVYCKMPGSSVFAWTTVPKVEGKGPMQAAIKVHDAFAAFGVEYGMMGQITEYEDPGVQTVEDIFEGGRTA